MRYGKWVAVLALLAVGGAAAVDEGTDKAAPADAKALDAALNKSLREVINRGATLYNKGDHAGCYRVFQGGLTVAEGLLDRHPELKKIVADALAGAERDPLVWRRAFTLRAALDKVRKGLGGKGEAKTKDKEPVKDDDMKKAEEKIEDKKKGEEKKDDEKKGDEKQKETGDDKKGDEKKEEKEGDS